LNQISNFQQPKNSSLFLFSFFFSVFACHYFFSYLSGPSHYLDHNFFADESAVRSNRVFGPPTQFPLVIFDLNMPTATFGHPGCRTALRCVVHR
jgi:hypothetical protein